VRDVNESCKGKGSRAYRSKHRQAKASKENDHEKINRLGLRESDASPQRIQRKPLVDCPHERDLAEDLVVV